MGDRDSEDQLYAEVVFNLPMLKSYHYLVPSGSETTYAQCQSAVPFGTGQKLTQGTVLFNKDANLHIATSKPLNLYLMPPH